MNGKIFELMKAKGTPEEIVAEIETFATANGPRAMKRLERLVRQNTRDRHPETAGIVREMSLEVIGEISRIQSLALIWSDRVNGARSVGVAVLALSRGQSEQQPEQVERRLISLIFAGRNRIIMIRRELPLTVIASPAEPVA
jgi:hypothetical protein